MRLGWITTGTQDLVKITTSTHCVPDIETVGELHYNFLSGKNTDARTVESYIKAIEPDVLIYIGAAHGINPSAELLASINRELPVYHLCCDAADPPWWPLIEQYRKAHSFTKQINIDGNKDNPCDMTLLTPMNPNMFNLTQVKDIEWAFMGGVGGSFRRPLMAALEKREGLKTLSRTPNRTYAAYIEYLGHCRSVLNTSLTGSGTRHHVKGRVLEALYSGARLIEMEQAPTKEYFTVDEDYVSYDGTVDSAIRALKSNKGYASNRRDRAIALYGPIAFFTQVLS